jgi:VWFA-related protein
MSSRRSRPGIATRVFLLVVFGLFVAVTAHGQRNKTPVTTSDHEVTILVTASPHNERSREIAAKLQPDDFAVREDNQPQKIVSVKRAGEAPTMLAVLIQDDLVSRVNNELRGIKDFIRNLPEGSRVMTGYLTTGTLQIAQDFTSDRVRAADSLRIVHSSRFSAPFNPYVEVIEALRRFDAQPAGRRLVLLISDGLDASRGLRSASPMFSLDLDRAIVDAQRRGVAVFTFYAPSVGLTSFSRLAVNYGQGSLNRFADETGGEAFFSGTDFVTFSYYFKELEDLLGRQWLVTYQSSGTKSGFRRVEVVTDFDVDLNHAAGYEARSTARSSGSN